MRVAYNGWFWDQPHTGSGQYLRALLAHLPAEFEPVVVLPRPAPKETDYEARFAFHVARSPASRSNLGKVYFEQFAYPRACRALRADLAHVPHWAPPLRSPAPIVVTVHDLIPLILPEYSGSLRVRLYTALVSAATRGAARVIADSQASRLDALERLGLRPERVRAVHLAAGPEYRPGDSFGPDPTLHAAMQRKYNLPDGYVLYLGGFDPRKNVRGLLAGWTWAAGAIGEGFPLVIAGQLPRPSGFFEDYRAYAAELNILDSVRFVGPVDEADKPALYRGAACFVYPSQFEGFGLPVLEAMACGTPVVTTAGGSLPEVAGDAAYLVSADDARSIGAGIIATVVQENLAEELRQKGLAQAAKFSWDKTAGETVEVYQEALEGKGNRKI